MTVQVHIVDDDEAIRDSFVWLLEGHGLTSLCHASAEAFEAHLASMGDGPADPYLGIGELQGFNTPLIKATSSFAFHHGTDFDREELKGRLREAMTRR